MTSMTSLPPTYDVVLPTAGKRCICKTLQSVNSQSLMYSSFFVVSDGNPLKKCCKELISKIPRTVNISLSTNVGVSAARNIAVEESISDFVAFIDDDDQWMPNKIEIQMQIIYEVGVSMIGTNALRSSNHKPYFVSEKEGRKKLRDLLNRNVYITSSVVLRRELLSSIGGFPNELSVGEDYATWLVIQGLGEPCFYLAKPLVIYEDEGDSLSRNTNLSAIEQKTSALYCAQIRLNALGARFNRRMLSVLKIKRELRRAQVS